MHRSLASIRPDQLAYRAFLQALREGSTDLAAAALRLYRKTPLGGTKDRRAVNSSAGRRDLLMAVTDRLRSAAPHRGRPGAILPFRRS